MKNFFRSLCLLFPVLYMTACKELELLSLAIRDPVEDVGNHYGKYLRRCFAGDREAQNLLFQYENRQLSRFGGSIDPSCYNNLGFLYKNGWGCYKDERKAVHYFQEAVYRGFYLSYFNLSIMYYKGRGGLISDREMAFFLFLEGLKRRPHLVFFFQGLCEVKQDGQALRSWINSPSDFPQPEWCQSLSREQAYAYFETFVSYCRENKENEILQNIANIGNKGGYSPLYLHDSPYS